MCNLGEGAEQREYLEKAREKKRNKIFMALCLSDRLHLCWYCDRILNSENNKPTI
jgi:hypothetical protein